MNNKKCTRCKVNYSLDHFDAKLNGELLKRCKRCIKVIKECKCVHGRKKTRCVDCNGIGICIHRRRKDSCVDCHGSQICHHLKRTVEMR